MGRHTENLGTVLRGARASPGIVLGKAVRVDRETVKVEHVRLPESLVKAEVSRLHDAVQAAEAEIDELYGSLTRSGMGHGEHRGLLDAHKMMLRDPMLLDDTAHRIREERLNAEWALQLTLHHLGDIFAKVEDPFFRERGSDIAHVGELLLRMLAGGRDGQDTHVAAGSIVVSRNISPADALALGRLPVAAFVLDSGTPTSHTAIIARSLGIPAVVGLQNASDHIAEGDQIIVDGDEGEIIVHPSEDEELLYERRARRARVFMKTLRQNRGQPAETPDGSRMTLRGNLDFIGEADRILEFGGEGVGLFRTEFLFLDRPQLPSEEEQFQVYVSVLQRMNPNVVTIRTLDVGGDKVLPVERLNVTASPGLRAIRYCLHDQTLFRAHLRALLRASAYGKMRLLIPFISCMSEVVAVKRILASVRAELLDEGHPVAEHVPLGFMIEVPSAALISDLLAREADFFSVGTNDLIQYTLAISRDDPALDYLYHPLDPSILRVLRMITRSAHAAGIPVALCGEMAGEPRYALVLLALGFTELSMNARSIPLVKEIVRRTPMAEAIKLLQRLMRESSVAEITDVVDSFMVERFPEIITPRIRGAPRHMR